MSTAEDLEQSLSVWKQSKLINDCSAEHLDDETLYQLANSTTTTASDTHNKEHLSCCPICMEKWANWRKAITISQPTQPAQNEQEEFHSMSYGMLEAAADNNANQPLTLHSHCGSFCLGLFPDQECPESGLITLKITGLNPEQFEGQRTTVRDCHSKVILDSLLHDGRVARRIEHISDIDLTTWTIVFNEVKEEGDDT